MSLADAQLPALKAAIVADGTLNSQPQTVDGANFIAAAMNQIASPAFTVWKTLVSITQIGDKIDGSELAGLTTLNSTRLQTLVVLSQDGVNPSLANRRQFFADIFSGAGGQITSAALLALWKRLSTRGEKIYATGTGSDAAPATLVFEGAITIDDVQRARALP